MLLLFFYLFFQLLLICWTFVFRFLFVCLFFYCFAPLFSPCCCKVYCNVMLNDVKWINYKEKNTSGSENGAPKQDMKRLSQRENREYVYCIVHSWSFPQSFLCHYFVGFLHSFWIFIWYNYIDVGLLSTMFPLCLGQSSFNVHFSEPWWLLATGRNDSERSSQRKKRTETSSARGTSR